MKNGEATKIPRKATSAIRSRIERGGERLWRPRDFVNLPSTAVAKALSRLAREGALERLSKGIYFRGRDTAFGKSKPNPAAIGQLASRCTSIFPAGVAAAHLLGFTTQVARRTEIATTALSVPRKLVGAAAVIHTRRPQAWATLSETDAALLDFLRQRGRFSELTPEDTTVRILALLSEDGRYERLLKVAHSEPARVRAILGASGDQLRKNPKAIERLRASLNPFSRFDFGLLAGLPNAQSWQAKERK